ncbi:histidine kinase [Rivularia sp. PCC 7116]|uniref:DICT sensory domain-containing protein n=1 Tax=Rivularia sp. PCC 7116 TaxID=373994 RepID=UPI00029F3DB6|nr:DICT sensory domain-containing protein [Rivularia sp. PCC 7116]AFY58401.1 histidine kinase [Rivularia sp. PCC 7116]
MNLSPPQNLSIYQSAMKVQLPPKPLNLSCTTLLSMVKSQIDLLIEQEISATVVAKFPPLDIFNSQLKRYRQHFDNPLIYNCQLAKAGEINTEVNSNTLASIGNDSASDSGSKHNLIQMIAENRQIEREYFFIVLSAQFCSLLLAHRPLRKVKKQILDRKSNHHIPSLVTVQTFDGKVIEQVLNAIKNISNSEEFLATPEFSYPQEPKSALTSQLFLAQIKRQEQINSRKYKSRFSSFKEQNKTLQTKLQAKDEYLRNVCQELLSPLTHIKTALSLLNSPSIKTTQRQRYLDMIKRECDRQNYLMTGVMDLVELERNLESTSLEPVCLSEVVPGVVSTYQPLAQERGIMLAYTVPNDLPYVWCVSGGLRQIVINLLSNCIKFTPNGGQVWVRTRIQPNYVQLEFRDTGIGIPENEISKIFNRFYKVRPVVNEETGSAGLGLTIVEKLLQRCGGSISVSSMPGEGSSFKVLLPSVSQ